MSHTDADKHTDITCFFIPRILKVHRIAAVIFEIKTVSPDSVLVQHCREIGLVGGVEDLIVQHLTSVNDAVELQQHKKHTLKKYSYFDSTVKKCTYRKHRKKREKK
jgi:hypothetical protein